MVDFARGKNNIYFVFYEDLKEDPENEIRKLAKFLGFDYDEFIAVVAKMTSFDAMKTVTKSQAPDQSMAIKDETGMPKFMRKGTIEDWKNHFTVAENEMFDVMYSKEMEAYEDLTSRIKFQ